mgnify:CR=1 FL=1
MRKIIIMGAGGRDFHDFNVVYRDDADSEVGVIVKLLAKFLYLGSKNLVGDLSRDTSAVTRLRIGIDRATVHETAQSPKTSFKNIVGTLTVDLGNKPDTASVMFVLAVVESGGFV